jgi:hypothetical protein
MQEDLADDDRVLEEGHDPAFAKTVRAEQHVHLEEAAHQVGPGDVRLAAGSGFRWVRFLCRCGGLHMRTALLGPRRDDGGAQERGWRQGSHGRFSLGKLHPGTWSVTFHSWHFSPGSGVRVGSKELPPLTLRGGETRRVAYDVADMKPATVRGLVFLDGSPAANSRVRLNRLQRMHTTGRTRSGTTILSTDRDGAFLATGLYPGRYRLGLWSKRSGARNGTWLPCPTILVVPPGSRTSQTFQLQAGVLRVKVTTKGGGPAAHVLLDVRDPGSGLWTSGRTDAHGCLVLDPIAVGLYVVSLSLPTSSAPSRLRRVPSAPRPESLMRLGEARVLFGPKPSFAEYSIPTK